MFKQTWENIYRFFFVIYDSLRKNKNKPRRHKYEECNDEEMLYLNQTDDDLDYLEQRIKRDKFEKK
jgi:hypothetical protein